MAGNIFQVVHYIHYIVIIKEIDTYEYNKENIGNMEKRIKEIFVRNRENSF